MKVLIKTAKYFEKNSNVNIDFRLHDTDKRFRFSTGLKYTKENLHYAKVHLEELINKYLLKIGVLKGVKKYLLSELGEQALLEHSKDIGFSTARDYENIYNNAIKNSNIYNMYIDEIKLYDLKLWKSKILSRNISKSRFKKYYRVLKLIFDYAFENELIENNLIARLTLKSSSYKISDNSKKYYSKEEVNYILNHAKGKYRLMFLLLAYTGMRTGEAIALRWDKIDCKNKTLTIDSSINHGLLKSTKTGICNTIPMVQELQDALALATKESSAWVFYNPKSKKHYYDAKPFSRYLKSLLEENGMQFKTLYALRHTFASRLAEEGVSTVVAQKMLGHAKVSTTMNYYTKNGLLDNDLIKNHLEKMYG